MVPLLDRIKTFVQENKFSTKIPPLFENSDGIKLTQPQIIKTREKLFVEVGENIFLNVFLSIRTQIHLNILDG